MSFAAEHKRRAGLEVRATSDGGGYRSAAFTLIELLVCVAVIALLVSILLPALAGARETGRESVCSSNLRQLLLAAEMYADDSRGVYPAGAPDELANLTRWHGSRAAASGVFAPEGGTLTEYIGPDGGTGVRVCPTFAFTLKMLADRGLGFERSCGGYGYNNAFMGTMRRQVAPGLYTVGTDRTGSARHLFLSPMRTIAFADCAFATDEGGGPGVIEYSFAEPRFWPDLPDQRADPSIHFRHARRAGRAGVAWLDGHVSPQTMRFSWSSGLYGAEARDLGIGWPGDADDNSLFDYD